MNAQRVALDMPIDHDATPAVAHMPLRGQVLVPGAEVLGIRCTRRRPVTPDGWIASTQRAVCDDGNGLAQGIDRDIPAPDIGEILGGRAGLVGPNYTISANLGRQVGGNLFHSFGQFSLSNTPVPESATFTSTGSTGPISNGRVILCIELPVSLACNQTVYDCFPGYAETDYLSICDCTHQRCEPDPGLPRLLWP